MAANDSHIPTRTSRDPREPLTPAQLAARLEEEVNRAARHRTALSCVLVSIDDVERLASAHGESMPSHALAYLADALSRQLRIFDRVGHASDGELLVVLPGADEQRGEIVARRALGRLHSIKIEVDGRRRPLQLSMGIAAWHEGLTGEQLLFHTRMAAQRQIPLDRHAHAPAGAPSAGASEIPPLRPS
ncbi:MAG TPA: diguanylate cyclase [Solirubrobacteraceae bacterium]|jgi:diguanylate cyclase (GGDEF)-like protein